MKKKLNKKKLFYFIMLIILAIFVILGVVKGLKDFVFTEHTEEVKANLDSIELYGYTLDDKDTALYKKYFKELKNILNEKEIDYKKYAESITKLFVTDFYTLSNKLASTDIGALEFVHADMVDNFKTQAGDTMYNTVENNLNGNRTQKLPTVKDVTIEEITEEKYTYNEKEYEGYKIKCSWEYEEDLEYDDSAIFYVIKDNNKMNVVEEQLES